MSNHLSNRRLVFRALKLALPVSGAYLGVVLGLIAEFLIVGNLLGGEGIAAIGLAGTFALVLVLSFHGLEIASQALIARRFGEGNLPAAGRCLDNALIVGLVVGIPLAVILYFIAPIIFSSAASPGIERMATDYFHWRLPSLPLVILMLVTIGFFNGIGRPVIPMCLYGGILLLNAGLCFGLVGGRFGLPAMGIAGAGLAQSISAAAGLAGFLLVLGRRSYRQTFGVLQLSAHYDRVLMRTLLILAGPVFVQQFLGNFGMFLFVLINSWVPDGGISLSASTIARQIGYLTYLPSLGFGIAAATMVAQSLGAGDELRARRSGYLCWVLGGSMMAIGGVGFIVFREPLVGLFLAGSPVGGDGVSGAASLEHVAETAAMLLIPIGVYQTLEAVNTIVGKALQGAGATLFVMTAAVGCQWLIFLPLAWFLALPMELGAYGAVYAFAIQLSVVALLLIFRYRSKGWTARRI